MKAGRFCSPMETPVPDRPARQFGLIETTIIVIVVGMTALFAIPRFEARTELPVVEQAIRFGEWVKSHQSARYRKGLDFSMHIEQFHEAQSNERQVPAEFSLDPIKADGRKHWEMTLTRREEGSSFGGYKIVWDNQGYNRTKSTVPMALLPEDLLKHFKG
jgi:type IV pilus assembly protein PilA